MKTNLFIRIRLSSLSQSYLWLTNGNNDPKLQGEPDNSVFNKENGYEVVYMINYIMKGIDTYSSQVVREIEAMIHRCTLKQPSQVQVKDFMNKLLKLTGKIVKYQCQE